MRVLFGNLQTDQPDLLNGELEEAENCIPYAQSYGPFYDATPYSGSLSATCVGAVSTRDTTGNVFTFAGTPKQLYREASGTISNVSRTATYTTADDGYWEFTTFGNTHLAVNGIDALQVYTLGTSSQFLDASASASAPVAKHIATVRDFAVLGNLGTGANRTQWSRINNPLRYGPDARYQSDFQDLAGAEQNIQRITGGDFGTILTDNSVWRMTYVGSPLVFRFDEVAPGIGCAAPGSVARFQNLTFFLSHSGFYVFDGASATPIGQEQIDDTFIADFNASFRHRVSAIIDTINKLYLISYPSVNSPSGTPDKMLAYGWQSRRWTKVSEEMFFLFNHITGGSDLDSITANVDTLAYSLDSPIWQGGLRGVGCVNTSNRIARFEGDEKAARFTTGEGQLIADSRAFIRNIRPLVQGTVGNISATVGQRDLLTNAVVWGSASNMNTTIGDCPVRSNARYHRFRIDVTGGFQRVMGIDIDFTREGRR